GTTQVAFAVIATTAVLVAVFLPVGFLEGNTGAPVPRTGGTTQVAFAVIATTAVLVAVFLPVGFLEGNTGA
ncbi:hypothetical protein C7E25_24985, partial [Stenotrophomonas maltophilia]